MQRVSRTSMGGLTIIFFVIVISLSFAFYQFIFLKEVNLKPNVPEEVANPTQAFKITIVEGAALPANPKFFEPANGRATLGIDNKVVWENKDTTAHTVTTDTEFIDKFSGKFDSMDTIGLVTPGQNYEFIFTEHGDYAYHCEPHPWMTGVISVVENFG